MLATVLLFMYGTLVYSSRRKELWRSIFQEDLKGFLDISAKNFIQEYKNKYSEDKILRFLENVVVEIMPELLCSGMIHHKLSCSTVKTNLICNDNYIDVNVARQKDYPNSILNIL